MALGSFDAKLFDSSTSLDHIKKWLSGDVGITSLVSKPRLLDVDRFALNNSDTTSGTPLDITSVATTTSVAVFTANSITTGEVVKVVSSSIGLTGAGRLLLIDSTADFNDGTGIVAEIKTVHTTGTGLQLAMDSMTDGCGLNISVNGLTSGEGLKISSTSTAFTANGRLLHVQASGDFDDAGGQVVEFESAHTTGTGFLLTMDSVTDGQGLFMTIDALTTGRAVSVVSSSTGLTGVGRLLLIDSTADFNDVAGIVAEIKTVHTTGTGLQLAMDSVTDGLGLFMTIDALTTGIGVSVESSATAITGAGRLLLVNLTGATSLTGIVAEIRSAATDETALMRLQSGGTGIDLEIINTNTGALGPEIQTYHNVGNSAAADNDVVFRLRVDADDEESSATKRQLMALDVQWSDATAASFASDVEWSLATGAATNLCVTLSGAGLLSVDADGGGSDDPVSLFDKYDDALELRGMSLDRTKWYDRMVEMGVMVRKDSGCGYMLAIQKFMYLLAGGIYQTRQRLDDKVQELEAKIAKLELAA